VEFEVPSRNRVAMVREMSAKRHNFFKVREKLEFCIKDVAPKIFPCLVFFKTFFAVRK